MRTAARAAGALAVALFAAPLMSVGGSALAASRVVVLPGDDGDQILSVSEDEPGSQANLTLICSSRSAQFGIVLMAPALGFPPEMADLTFRADAAAIGSLRLSRQDKGLVLIGDGEGRDTIGKLARAAVVEINGSGLKLRFTLGGAATEVARYRETCRL